MIENKAIQWSGKATKKKGSEWHVGRFGKGTLPHSLMRLDGKTWGVIFPKDSLGQSDLAVRMPCPVPNIWISCVTSLPSLVPPDQHILWHAWPYILSGLHNTLCRHADKWLAQVAHNCHPVVDLYKVGGNHLSVSTLFGTPGVEWFQPHAGWSIGVSECNSSV